VKSPSSFPWPLEYSILDHHHHPRTTNRMTSPVPLRAYHQHTSSEDYAESITAAPSKSGTQSHGGEHYDPYSDTHSGTPWSDTAYSESVPDGLHKPSLSYDSKEPGKCLSNSLTSRCLRRPFPSGEPVTLRSVPDAVASDRRPLLARWFDPGKYPLEQRIENKRRGIGRQRYPVVGPCNRWPYLLSTRI
jgi:hypothetical protein